MELLLLKLTSVRSETAPKSVICDKETSVVFVAAKPSKAPEKEILTNLIDAALTAPLAFCTVKGKPLMSA